MTVTGSARDRVANHAQPTTLASARMVKSVCLYDSSDLGQVVGIDGDPRQNDQATALNRAEDVTIGSVDHEGHSRPVPVDPDDAVAIAVMD